MNVFLDTNVVIDFMGEREGFFEDAELELYGTAMPSRCDNHS